MIVHQLNWYCVWLPGWSMIICFLFCDGCSSVKLIHCVVTWMIYDCFLFCDGCSSVKLIHCVVTWMIYDCFLFCDGCSSVKLIHCVVTWMIYDCFLFCDGCSSVKLIHCVVTWMIYDCFLFCDGCSSVKLIHCVVTWMIYDCFLFCDGCSSVKLISVLQKNPPCPADSSVFQHLLHIWTLSSHDCMILRSIFSHWGWLRDSNTTIKNGSNIHWCSRRKHGALRAGGVKTFWIWRSR